ncbi:hypothetical protein HYFRA_00011057 [Hymenoscyphus fraxineus]|uniref:DUF7721 domain-containing protein n=1 Tax=Hymenoscyphus fraxineus TaxID=746836 RepID=A0A9N9L607_9HELO|nr:hypothetical protein HYFRA_00011057 [Hymenoscyphus fraxineus]
MSGEAKEYYSGASMESSNPNPNTSKKDDYDSDDETMQSASRHAEQHAGSSGSIDMFTSIVSSLVGNKQEIAQQPIDEQHAVKSHQQFFSSSSSTTEASSASMGSAAAMQALKMFVGGSESGSGGGEQKQSQNAFVGMAMAQASKLFDNQAAAGKVASGEKKESAVQQAGEMALKMYLQSGGKGGSGSGGLMGIASKFL